MSLMAVEVCIWHLWLQSSIYVIDSCGGLYMAFMAVEVLMSSMAWVKSLLF